MSIAETRMIALTVRHGPTAGYRTTTRATGPTRLSVPVGDFHKEQFVTLTPVHNHTITYALSCAHAHTLILLYTSEYILSERTSFVCLFFMNK